MVGILATELEAFGGVLQPVLLGNTVRGKEEYRQVQSFLCSLGDFSNCVISSWDDVLWFWHMLKVKLRAREKRIKKAQSLI